jgi:hypothetical protein
MSLKAEAPRAKKQAPKNFKSHTQKAPKRFGALLISEL